MVAERVLLVEYSQSKRCLPEGYRREQQQQDVRDWRRQCRRVVEQEDRHHAQDRPAVVWSTMVGEALGYHRPPSVRRCTQCRYLCKARR